MFVGVRFMGTCVTQPKPREYAFSPSDHFDLESAITAQNDEFKAVLIARFHVRQTSKLSIETLYLASILTDKSVRYNLPERTRKTELALWIKFYLDFHRVAWAW